MRKSENKQKKEGLLTLLCISKLPTTKNYFSWMGNFGVVPFVRSMALRFLPHLLLLLLRTASVCFVLETMKYLLYRINMLTIYWVSDEPILLPGLKQKVKIFLSVLIIGLPHPMAGAELEAIPETILLGVGEHRQLFLPELAQFSVSNKDCLSYKFGPKKGELWILAKKTGFSEIMGLDQKGISRKLQVYILSKRDQLKLQNVAQAAEIAGWKTTWVGHYLNISGEIKNANDYALAHQIRTEIKERGIFNLSLQESLAKEMIVKIYRELYENWADYFRCTYSGMDVECAVSQSNPPPAALLKTLSEKYLVQFRQVADKFFKKNFRAKLRFFQMSRADGQYFDLGMETLTTNIGSLFNRNALKQLVLQNDVLLKNENVELGILAEPEVLFHLGEEIEIKLGDEIPYQNYALDGKTSSLEWKFSGLQFRFKIIKVGEKFQMHYLVSYHRSGEGSTTSLAPLQQSKEEASLFVDSTKPTQLFQVGMVALEERSVGIPGLAKIPLIGRAFREDGKSQIFKRVSALFMLEEIAL